MFPISHISQIRRKFEFYVEYDEWNLPITEALEIILTLVFDRWPKSETVRQDEIDTQSNRTIPVLFPRIGIKLLALYNDHVLNYL